MEDQRKNRVMAATVEKAIILKETVSMHQAAVYLASGGVPLDVSIRVLTTSIRRGMVDALIDRSAAHQSAKAEAPAPAPAAPSAEPTATPDEPGAQDPAPANSPKQQEFTPSWRDIVFSSGPTFR